MASTLSTATRAKSAAVRRLTAEAEKAAQRAEEAKQQVRLAKAELKKARKASKLSKKAAKQARKKAKAAQAAGARRRSQGACVQKSPGRATCCSVEERRQSSKTDWRNSRSARREGAPRPKPAAAKPAREDRRPPSRPRNRLPPSRRAREKSAAAVARSVIKRLETEPDKVAAAVNGATEAVPQAVVP